MADRRGCSVKKFVTHSARVLRIAARYGWLPGARYTNLRDVRDCAAVAFIDIDWKNYDFEQHMRAVKATRPHLTVARDVEHYSDLKSVLRQAEQLARYADRVIVVPKDKRLIPQLRSIASDFILGFSVPTRYGHTPIPIHYFDAWPVHLLGGRPDKQRLLAQVMNVVSVDCNRFTLDAAYGDYFDGETFRPHPAGGYERCVADSLKNINKLWWGYGHG
jgi:hypothetical protein